MTLVFFQIIGLLCILPMAVPDRPPLRTLPALVAKKICEPTAHQTLLVCKLQCPALPTMVFDRHKISVVWLASTCHYLSLFQTSRSHLPWFLHISDCLFTDLSGKMVEAQFKDPSCQVGISPTTKINPGDFQHFQMVLNLCLCLWKTWGFPTSNPSEFVADRLGVVKLYILLN